MPIVASKDLPQIGAFETATLDFKRQHAGESYELAKDVAALANHLGGTILVGAVEGAHRLSKWLPMNEAAAVQARHDYHLAVRDRCSPRPAPEIAVLAVDGGFVVAVNVPAQPDHVVGVRCSKDEPLHWVFPVRTTTQTKFISPEQLPMYMTPHVRRMVILLSAIRDHDSVAIRLLNVHGGIESFGATIAEIRADENALVVRRQGAASERRLPLDQIKTVFKRTERDWSITFELF